MHVGDRVIFHGETLVVSGFMPMSIVPQLAYLDDPATGERLEVPMEELEPGPDGRENLSPIRGTRHDRSD
jgi:hypothetical protein